jgi:hypothetical protein
MNDDKKIMAIKYVRQNGNAVPANQDLANPSHPTLGEAKDAVEMLVDSYPWDNLNRPPRAVIGAGFKVKKLVVDIAGEGEVELDLEGLQLRFLQDLDSIGLSEVQHLLELTEYIRGWQR